MFRPTLEAQNGSGGSRDAKHHQYASDEIHCTTSVGLTRIELVTSSLSGMRSIAVLRSLEPLPLLINNLSLSVGYHAKTGSDLLLKNSHFCAFK